ncbi:MAG: hypothetical protein H5T69_20885, partial [Chloroflexi bacterium]|nr:hypothetical protein [Chloroflexota bacterium]
MKGKLLASLLLVLVWVLVLMGGQGGFAASPCTVTLDPGDDIQAAINAANPGDVICLNPGLYTPSATIVINKPLTLQGPRAGVDPRPSFGSTRTPGDASGEAIIDGAPYNLYNIILVDADDVVIDGLEVR